MVKLNEKRLCRRITNLIDNFHFHRLYRKYFKALNIFQQKKPLDGNLVYVSFAQLPLMLTRKATPTIKSTPTINVYVVYLFLFAVALLCCDML